LKRVLGRRNWNWLWLAAGVYATVSMALLVVWPVRSFSSIETFNFFDPLVAARVLRSGSRCIYCPAAQQAAASSWVHGSATSSFVDPPPAAFLLQPVAGLDVHAAVITLLAVSLICVVIAGWFLYSRILPSHLASPRRIIVVCASIFTAASNALWAGQWTPILLLPAVGAVLCIGRGKHFTAGILLSLLLLKPQLVWLLPVVLIGSRQWKALAGMAAGGLVWVGSSLLILGFQHLPDWQAALSSASGSVDFSDGIPGFVSVLTSSTSAAIWTTAALGVLTAAMALRWGPRLRDSPELVVGIGIAASLATSPHVFDYDLILLALPLCLWARTDVAAAMIAAVVLRGLFVVSFSLGSVSPAYVAWIIPAATVAGLILALRGKGIVSTFTAA